MLQGLVNSVVESHSQFTDQLTCFTSIFGISDFKFIIVMSDLLENMQYPLGVM